MVAGSWRAEPSGAAVVLATSMLAPLLVATQIGLFMSGRVEGKILSPEVRLDVARRLGGTLIRTAINLDGADHWLADANFVRAGFRPVVTVRNTVTNADATEPPQDLGAYAAKVGTTLARYEKAVGRPELVVVENEENAPRFYSGTPEGYLAQLAAAVRAIHARGLRATNGGIAFQAIALATWQDYVRRGMAKEAESYADRTFQGRMLLGARRPGAQARVAEVVEGVRKLVAGYRATGVDDVNFHWYGKDAAAMGETAAYLRRETGLPLVNNEMGQWDRDGATVTASLAKARELGLAYVLWYSGDGETGAAVALENADGTLRPGGEAFRKALSP